MGRGGTGKAYSSRMRRFRNPLEGSGTYHVLTNEWITLDGDRASALTKWIFITPAADGAPSIQVLGHYNDEFVREKVSEIPCVAKPGRPAGHGMNSSGRFNPG